MIRAAAALATLLVAAGCTPQARLPVTAGTGPDPALPPPQQTLIPTVNIAPAQPWPQGGKPDPAPGLAVTAFARGLEHPRWLYVLPNGDVLVAETAAPPRPEDTEGPRGVIRSWIMGLAGAGVASANRISLLRDTDHDGVADLRTVFIDDLNSPFGMALVGNDFYVANTDALLRFPYRTEQTSVSDNGRIVTHLPAGPINHHWTKNVIASPDGEFLYVTVGSNSNAAEYGITAERGRAAVWQVHRASGRHKLYATGLRNPNGLAWVPATGALWVTVNERDFLGSDLVPDYMTALAEGGFYGWPYSYFGQHIDPQVQQNRPELVERAIVPDYALGPHTASLGLTYSGKNALTPRFWNGMFVGQHGSWNRDPLSGYKVVFVPFENGQPAGPPVDVLTGFVNAEGEALGRPVGVAMGGRGALFVADDVGNVVWRVAAADAPAAAAKGLAAAPARPRKRPPLIAPPLPGSIPGAQNPMATR